MGGGERSPRRVSCVAPVNSPSMRPASGASWVSAPAAAAELGLCAPSHPKDELRRRVEIHPPPAILRPLKIPPGSVRAPLKRSLKGEDPPRKGHPTPVGAPPVKRKTNKISCAGPRLSCPAHPSLPPVPPAPLCAGTLNNMNPHCGAGQGPP